MAIIDKYIEAGKKYYIYGTQNVAIYCFNEIVSKYGDDNVIGFVETRPSKVECCKKRVFSLVEVEFDEKTVFLLTAVKRYEEMRQSLLLLGVANENIVWPQEIMHFFKTLRANDDIAPIRKICYWPPIEGREKDLLSKIAWFIPDRIMVSVFTEKEKKLFKLGDNVFFEDINSLANIFVKVDYIYLWDVSKEWEELKGFENKIKVVDPNFFKYIETLNYNRLYYYSFTKDEKQAYLHHSLSVFKEMQCKYKEYIKANIFCSGPSIEECYGGEYRGAFNVICNSMVKDKELLKTIKPSVLVFDDANFYLSPHAYCEKFFEDVLEGAQEYEYYIVVDDWELPLVLRHFPKLRNRVMGIPNMMNVSNIPDVDNFFVRHTSNIFTMLMLPIASAVCDEISIYGCTGRNSDEKYYWKHHGRMQYTDLMKSVFDMYPSVFKHQNYEDYYERHCMLVREMLEYGEERGKKYKNLTTSYIPALIERSKKNTDG